MNIAGKYNNYDPHPKKVIPGFEDQAWEGVPVYDCFEIWFC